MQKDLPEMDTEFPFGVCLLETVWGLTVSLRLLSVFFFFFKINGSFLTDSEITYFSFLSLYLANSLIYLSSYLSGIIQIHNKIVFK